MSVKFPVRSEIQEKVRHIPVNPRRYCGHIISGDSFRFTAKSKYRYRMAIKMIVSGSSMHVPIWHGWPPDRNFQFGLLGWRQKWTMAEQQFDPRSISWDSFYGIFSFSCPGLNSPLGAGNWKTMEKKKEGRKLSGRMNRKFSDKWCASLPWNQTKSTPIFLLPRLIYLRDDGT